MSHALLPFAKMNGAGNSILVVDLRGTTRRITGEDARNLATNPQLRFDQLMAIRDAQTPGTLAFVDIFNIDGSRAGACGNGTRCVAWVLARGTDLVELVVETASGLLPCRKLDDVTFSVDMGTPRFGWRDIPLEHPVDDTKRVKLASAAGIGLPACSVVNMGNPHAVFFVPDASAVTLETIGPQIEHDPLFPDRANISFAEIVSRQDVTLRVWERGAGATLACGSAACATLVAAVRAGLTDRSARVSLPGGDLQIAWLADEGPVVMTGPVELEHEGATDLEALELAP